MQQFIDTATSEIWSFEDDVKVAVKNFVYSFSTKDGLPLSKVPATLQPYTPTSADLLKQAQAEQTKTLQASAQLAETTPMSFTTAGKVTDTFPMDSNSWTKYQGAQLHYVIEGVSLPANFSFINTKGTAVAFTAADIKAFYAAGITQINDAIDKLAGLVAQVNSAATIPDVQAIVW